MKNKSLNLIRVFLKKEGVFWSRTWSMRKKTGLIGFIVALPFITVAHYAFALMHFLFECLLYVVNRPMYRANILKLQGAP